MQRGSRQEIEPIIGGVLARGTLCYLAAASQTGKTLFVAAWLVRHLAQGGKLFDDDRFKIARVEKILYLVLEDPARRVKERLLDTAHEFPTPLDPERVIFQTAP